MIVNILMKNPDAVGDAINEAVRTSMIDMTLSEEEEEALFEVRSEKVAEDIRPWVDCGEYIEIEIDTDAGTAKVVPQ